MDLAKTAAALGALSLACVFAVGLSHSGDDGVSGPLTRLLAPALEGAVAPAGLKPVGVFDIYEANLRLLLQVLAVAAAIASGALAVSASKRAWNSLWYSIGIFASAAALSTLSYVGAAGFLLICGWQVMRNRNWKMPGA